VKTIAVGAVGDGDGLGDAIVPPAAAAAVADDVEADGSAAAGRPPPPNPQLADSDTARSAASAGMRAGAPIGPP
jgi:hypothetical protein